MGDHISILSLTGAQRVFVYALTRLAADHAGFVL